jgi:hypothetical protein
MRAASFGLLAVAAAGCAGWGVTVAVPIPVAPPPPATVLVEAPAIDLDVLHGRFAAAQKINSPFERDEAMKKLAADAAQFGDAPDRGQLLAFVRQCLTAIHSPFGRDEAGKGCALALARRGCAAEATELASSIGSPFERDEVLKRLAAGNY